LSELFYPVMCFFQTINPSEGDKADRSQCDK
jgi:hypothetical protein